MFQAKSKIFLILLREILYAEDINLVTHMEEDTLAVMTLFFRSCTTSRITIRLKKTKVMFTSPKGQSSAEPNIFVQGTRLDVVDSIVYLGSTLSRDGSLDSEINLTIEKASKALGKLEDRMESDKYHHQNQKLWV